MRLCDCVLGALIAEKALLSDHKGTSVEMTASCVYY